MKQRFQGLEPGGHHLMAAASLPAQAYSASDSIILILTINGKHPQLASWQAGSRQQVLPATCTFHFELQPYICFPIDGKKSSVQFAMLRISCSYTFFKDTATTADTEKCKCKKSITLNTCCISCHPYVSIQKVRSITETAVQPSRPWPWHCINCSSIRCSWLFVAVH